MQTGKHSRDSTTSGAATRLAASLDTSLRIYHPARGWMRYTYESFDENPYQPRVAQKVVGLAFLSAVAAWEQFVESVFLGYMAGAQSGSGYAPQLKMGACQNRSHALHVLSASTNDPYRLLRWNDWAWVRRVAAVFFERGEPFTMLDAHTIARLGDAQVIRNRVAHDSARARLQFKRCVNALQSAPLDKPLPRGFTPGEFLAGEAEPKHFPVLRVFPAEEHQWGDSFESFISMFFESAATLSPTQG